MTSLLDFQFSCVCVSVISAMRGRLEWKLVSRRPLYGYRMKVRKCLRQARRDCAFLQCTFTWGRSPFPKCIRGYVEVEISPFGPPMMYIFHKLVPYQPWTVTCGSVPWSRSANPRKRALADATKPTTTILFLN